LDRRTGEIIAYHVGGRSREDAKKFWQSFPPVYRQCAVIYSDKWEAYRGIIPSKRHRIVEKSNRETNHIERFNNTLRQRISRLGRKTLSFSKKLSQHLASIWQFIHHYNSSLPLNVSSS
jgi:IS1 family transposase